MGLTDIMQVDGPLLSPQVFIPKNLNKRGSVSLKKIPFVGKQIHDFWQIDNYAMTEVI